MSKPFRIVDIFCGIGGFSTAFQKAGATTVYAIENDKYKREMFKISHGYYPQADDIVRVCGSDIPTADCWCFGFPCKQASIAGEKTGLDGADTGLFFEVMRLLDEIKEEDRPRYLLAENVRNLLSVNGGRDFERILAEMDARGYDVQWQVIDSKYFLPQHRERIYICGCLRGKCSCEILPVEISVTEDEVQVIQVMEWESHRKNPNQYRAYDPIGLSPTITNSEGGGRTPHVIERIPEPRRGMRTEESLS